MSNFYPIFPLMKEKEQYAIRFAAKITGLKPHILRSWEQRYSAVCPDRSESNRRCYSYDDIRRLQLLKVAVHSGHSISQVATMKDEELASLNDRALSLNTESISSKFGGRDEGGIGEIIYDALEYIRRLDQGGLESVLERAAVELPRSKFLHSVVQPLLNKVGELWASGDLKIIHERMASIVTRSLLLEMLRAVFLAETAPRLIVAAPVGQWHETGALVVALTAAESGWQPLYFGPNLPAEEIAAAAQKTNSKAIALSIGHRIDDALVIREVRKVKNYCAKYARVFVGGYGTFVLKKRIQSTGVKVIVNVDDFRSELEASQ